MGESGGRIWRPKEIFDYRRTVTSSTLAVEVETDAGTGYLKAMGNPEGPHALASEWIGTQLAKLFGLRTFDCAVIQVEPHNEIWLSDKLSATPGPGFVTRAERGNSWGGGLDELSEVQNPEQFTQLIVFDTWVRNRDRYCARANPIVKNRGNVFLSREGVKRGRSALVAMDFTHCISPGTELTRRVAHIGEIKDETPYGAFPEFAPYFDENEVRDCRGRLLSIAENDVARIVHDLPDEWRVDRATKVAIREFILRRAEFVASLPVEHFRPNA